MEFKKYDDFLSCVKANQEARAAGHPVGSYDNPKTLSIGWFDHTTQVAHTITLTAAKGMWAQKDWISIGLDFEKIRKAMLTPESREEFFGGRTVPIESACLEVGSRKMPFSHLRVTGVEEVIFFNELMVSQLDTKGHAEVKIYRLVEEK